MKWIILIRQHQVPMIYTLIPATGTQQSQPRDLKDQRQRWAQRLGQFDLVSSRHLLPALINSNHGSCVLWHSQSWDVAAQIRNSVPGMATHSACAHGHGHLQLELPMNINTAELAAAPSPLLPAPGLPWLRYGSSRPSPCSQFFPPNRSGHLHRYVFHLLTQVPPFWHEVPSQKFL
jgi:hypothetical protein